MILLYNPASSAGKKPVLPMAVLSLGAVLEGVTDYKIVDGNLEADPVQALDKLISESDIDILGVTVMGGPQLENSVAHCSAIKAKHPDLKIVWGGYFPTQHYEVCLKADYVDYVVRGHGEYVFRDFILALKNGKDPQGLAGLAFKDDGSPKTNPMAPIPKPDDLPDFPYERIDMSRYLRKTFMGERTAPHHSSYGCPFHCNFCAVVNMVNGKWLSQSADRTASVVDGLVKNYGADAIEFYDNNFFVHEARVLEFSERIEKHKLGWWGEARIDTMMKYSDPTWKKMQDSGLRMVFLGAESGSNETLQRMNKGGKASIEKTLEIASKMKQYDIIPEMSFVLGNPPEAEKDAEETMAFIRKVKQVNDATEIILYMYTPVPLSGTLFDQAKADGFAFPDSLEDWVGDEWKEFSQRRSAQVPGVKDPLRKRIHGFEQVLNAYYPTSTDTSITGVKRGMLRALGGWRYHSGFYQYPIELKVFNKLFGYRRPETSSF